MPTRRTSYAGDARTHTLTIAITRAHTQSQSHARAHTHNRNHARAHTHIVQHLPLAAGVSRQHHRRGIGNHPSNDEYAMVNMIVSQPCLIRISSVVFVCEVRSTSTTFTYVYTPFNPSGHGCDCRAPQPRSPPRHFVATSHDGNIYIK